MFIFLVYNSQDLHQLKKRSSPSWTVWIYRSNIPVYLDDWENLRFEDKRKADDDLISSTSVTGNYIKIGGKFDTLSTLSHRSFLYGCV